MSTEGEKAQDFSLRGGLGLFHNQPVQQAAGNGQEKVNVQEKVNDQPPVRKESTSTNASSASNVKLCGSNRLFMPIKK